MFYEINFRNSGSLIYHANVLSHTCTHTHTHPRGFIALLQHSKNMNQKTLLVIQMCLFMQFYVSGKKCLLKALSQGQLPPCHNNWKLRSYRVIIKLSPLNLCWLKLNINLIPFSQEQPELFWTPTATRYLPSFDSFLITWLSRS